MNLSTSYKVMADQIQPLNYVSARFSKYQKLPRPYPWEAPFLARELIHSFSTFLL